MADPEVDLRLRDWKQEIGDDRCPHPLRNKIPVIPLFSYHGGGMSSADSDQAYG